MVAIEHWVASATWEAATGRKAARIAKKRRKARESEDLPTVRTLNLGVRC
jgi:hypothetical protein